MSKRNLASCSDCYFRREGLCALPGDTVCPTFRMTAKNGALDPPRQPRLVPRPIASQPAPAYA
jgi:hypothetical protein